MTDSESPEEIEALDKMTEAIVEHATPTPAACPTCHLPDDYLAEHGLNCPDPWHGRTTLAAPQVGRESSESRPTYAAPDTSSRICSACGRRIDGGYAKFEQHEQDTHGGADTGFTVVPGMVAERDFKAEAAGIAKLHGDKHDYQCSWCGAKPDLQALSLAAVTAFTNRLHDLQSENASSGEPYVWVKVIDAALEDFRNGNN